jgi:hypothetical protein
VQWPAGVTVPFAQLGVPQDVAAGAFWQAPAPSQVPVKPHGGATVQRPCGSVWPGGTTVHVPALPATLHDEHVPQLADPQQTPSTQELPVRHSSVDAQASPRRFFAPHLPVMGSQIWGATQSASEPQDTRHVVPSHLYGAHESVAAALQTPAPSQVRARDSIAPPTGQVEGAHDVPAG